MTEPASRSSASADGIERANHALPLSQLGADVLELIRHAAGAGLLPGIVTETAEANAGAALRRLARGRHLSGDEALLGFPVAGSRLVHVTVISTDADRLAPMLKADRGEVITHLAPDELVMLVRDVPRVTGDDRGLRDARRLAALVHRFVSCAAVGISNPVSTAESLAAAAADAADAAQLAKSSGVPTLECHNRWASLALMRIRRHLGESMHELQPVERLRAYDQRHRTDLARTLAAWLRNNQDTRQTAEELAIHPNTLRYRVRRAAELAALDLDDPEQRIVMQFALGVMSSSKAPDHRRSRSETS